MQPTNNQLTIQRLKRRILSNYKLVKVGLVAACAIGILCLLVIFGLPFLRIAKDLIFGPVNIASVLLPTDSEIRNTNGRTNILLLGIGGAHHDGPNLSDTMLVASLKTKLDDNEKAPPILLISLPRDIYLESLNDKINFAYAKGAAKSKGAGLTLAKAAVTKVTGLPIHYALVGDFDAFQQTVDLLGGVDINVKHTLDDPQYPLPFDEVKEKCDGKEEEDPCWYETLHFDPGMTHMNGETALKFVRSRHATGSEGSDFARSSRQQQVISAVKDKFFSTQTFLNPTKIEQVYNLLKSHIYTDADINQLNLFLRLMLNYRGGQFKSLVLDDKLLDNPQPIDERGWILVPKDGTFKQIHKYIQKQIEGK